MSTYFLLLRRRLECRGRSRLFLERLRDGTPSSSMEDTSDVANAGEATTSATAAAAVAVVTPVDVLAIAKPAEEDEEDEDVEAPAEPRTGTATPAAEVAVPAPVVVVVDDAAAAPPAPTAARSISSRSLCSSSARRAFCSPMTCDCSSSFCSWSCSCFCCSSCLTRTSCISRRSAVMDAPFTFTCCCTLVISERDGVFLASRDMVVREVDGPATAGGRRRRGREREQKMSVV